MGFGIRRWEALGSTPVIESCKPNYRLGSNASFTRDPPNDGSRCKPAVPLRRRNGRDSSKIGHPRLSSIPIGQ